MSLLGSIRNVGAAAAGRRVLSRSLVTLPELKYDFAALEPAISGQINELHYTKHHKAYCDNFNASSEKYAVAVKDNDITAQIQLLPLINFNGGGYINHDLWWAQLAPQNQGGGEPPASGSALALAIEQQYGSLDKLINVVNTRLAGIQGSGWGWVVKDKITGDLNVITTANQDIVPPTYQPVIGIDAWEHAYYLQYKNVKADYFKNVWNVINWKEAEKRFDAA